MLDYVEYVTKQGRQIKRAIAVIQYRIDSSTKIDCKLKADKTK